MSDGKLFVLRRRALIDTNYSYMLLVIRGKAQVEWLMGARPTHYPPTYPAHPTKQTLIGFLSLFPQHVALKYNLPLLMQ